MANETIRRLTDGEELVLAEETAPSASRARARHRPARGRARAPAPRARRPHVRSHGAVRAADGCQRAFRLKTCPSRGLKMLATIAVVLIVLWLLGLVSSYTMGGFIHLLLVLAIAIVLIRIIQGRSPV